MTYLSTAQHQNIQSINSFLSTKQGNKMLCYIAYSFNDYNNYNYYNGYPHNNNFKCLQDFGSKSDVFTSSSHITYNLVDLACNQSSIYGADAMSIRVFNDDLQYIKTISSITPINKLEASDERLFALDTSQLNLSIIKISDDTIERKFAFAHDNLIYHLNSFVVSVDKQYNKLICYDINGQKYETYLDNFPNEFSIADSSETDLICVNHASFTLFYQS